MRTSETTGAIGAALAKAQGAMASAKQDGHNSHYGNSYASLGSLLRVAKSTLAGNGIAVVQGTESLHIETGPLAIVVSRLLHSSGEWIESEVSLPLERVSAQDLGKALTYLRRYSLAALVGIVADEDDDGEGDLATRPPQTATPPPSARRKPTPPPAPRSIAEPGGGGGGEVAEFEGTLDDVRKTPTKGGTKWGLRCDSWEAKWASTFDEAVGTWLEARVGKTIRAKVKRSGQFWNLIDAVEVTPSGGQVSPIEDIPF